jgi:23S rRNA (uracil1939-C5)-methyltransferase
VKLGFRGRGSHDVIDLTACPVMVPALESAVGVLRDEIASVGGEGEVGIALGARGRPVANIRPFRSLGQGAFAIVDRLVTRGFAGAAIWPPGATTPAVAGDPHPVARGGDGGELRLGLEGFAQANDALNAALAKHVLEEAQPSGRVVLELFAGAGNFTVLLARGAMKVIAVESDRDAVEAMRENLAARALANVSVVAMDAAAAVKKADVVVLDPPRTGAREVCDQLVARAPKRIVYVSCDAATLGRDLAILDRAMQLDRLVVFEMFPQTPHLETVATLVKRRP